MIGGIASRGEWRGKRKEGRMIFSLFALLFSLLLSFEGHPRASKTNVLDLTSYLQEDIRNLDLRDMDKGFNLMCSRGCNPWAAAEFLCRQLFSVEDKLVCLRKIYGLYALVKAYAAWCQKQRSRCEGLSVSITHPNVLSPQTHESTATILNGLFGPELLHSMYEIVGRLSDSDLLNFKQEEATEYIKSLSQKCLELLRVRKGEGVPPSLEVPNPYYAFHQEIKGMSQGDKSNKGKRMMDEEIAKELAPLNKVSLFIMNTIATMVHTLIEEEDLEMRKSFLHWKQQLASLAYIFENAMNKSNLRNFNGMNNTQRAEAWRHFCELLLTSATLFDGGLSLAVLNLIVKALNSTELVQIGAYVQGENSHELVAALAQGPLALLINEATVDKLAAYLWLVANEESLNKRTPNVHQISQNMLSLALLRH